MDHRKIPLDPEELKKLKALLKEEEAKVDELSDQELEEAEKALSLRIRNLARMQSEQSPSEKTRERENITLNWQNIQKQLGPTSRHDFTEDDKVVSIQSKKKKHLPWGTISILAVAAVALLVFFPKIKKNDPNDLSDPSNMQVKGTGSAVAYTSFCDIDVVGPTPESVEEAGNGMGYDVRVHDNFHITVLCDHAGFVQLWSNGSPATELRNVPVEANVRSPILQDGKTAEFNLRGSKGLIYGVALTEGKIDTSVNLFDAPIPAPLLGASEPLWSDSINIRGRTR